MKKQSQVTEQTRKNLFEAFWKLYETEDITKITIGKICKIANYDRTTFYRYFVDIDDILNKFEDEIIDNLRKDIKNKGTKLEHISLDRFKIFTEKYGKYIIVFYEKGNRRFYIKFKELIINEVYDLLDFNIQGDVNKNFLYEFLFSSIIISYDYWYRHSEIMSFESFVTLLNNMLLNGSKIIISNLK